jgi:hypothetical protein
MGKGKNLYEYVYHNKICGGGEGVYLHIYNGEITYSLLGRFVVTKLNIYQNRFGEPIKGRSINDEYILNQETFNQVLLEYRNLSYCKYFKINQTNFLTTLEEDEDSA